MDVSKRARPLVLRRAIPTAPIHLPKRIGKEVLHGHRSTSVVLEDLVRSRLRSSTVDIRSSRSLLERRSVLADIEPPNVVQGACTKAMDSFTVVGTNDDVREDCASIKHEDTVCVAAFRLPVARAGLIFFFLAIGKGGEWRGILEQSNFFMPPSKVAPAAMVLAAERALVPLLAGKTVCRAVLVARTSRTAALEPAKKAVSPMRTV